MYLFVTNREKELIGVKDYFRYAFDKKKMTLCSITFGVSVFVLMYSFYFVEASFLKSFMNAEVAIWLSILAYIDCEERIIPNELILTGITFWIILTLVEIFVAHTSWKQILFFSFVGAGVCGGVLFIIALIVKNALGMGDVKMFFVIGLLYGMTNTYSILLFSVIAMAIVSVVLLIRKKVTYKTAIPMAPYVVLGFLINVLVGM